MGEGIQILCPQKHPMCCYKNGRVEFGKILKLERRRKDQLSNNLVKYREHFLRILSTFQSSGNGRFEQISLAKHCINPTT